MVEHDFLIVGNISPGQFPVPDVTVRLAHQLVGIDAAGLAKGLVDGDELPGTVLEPGDVGDVIEQGALLTLQFLQRLLRLFAFGHVLLDGNEVADFAALLRTG